MKAVNLKKKIGLYRKKGWHSDIVRFYDLYMKNKNNEAKEKIVNHYKGKKIIWESEGLIEKLKETERKLDHILSKNDDNLDRVFFDFTVSEKIKEIFEKKEIKIGRIISNFLVKKILLKDKIKLQDFSITEEIVVLQKLIRDEYVNANNKKIMQKPISLERVKQKIKNIRNNSNDLYLFLEDYFTFVFKTKKIDITDLKKRNLILRLIDKRKINLKNYCFSRDDLEKINDLLKSQEK